MERRQADTIPLNTGQPSNGQLSNGAESVDGSGSRDYAVIGPSQPAPVAPSQSGPTAPNATPPNPASPSAAPPSSPQPERRGGMPRSIIAAIVVGVLIVSCAVALNITTGALGKLNPFRNGLVHEQTIDRSSPAVLKAISDLGQFEAASGYYQLVVDVEKDIKLVPSFLAGQRELFIAAGTVPVGVDLRGLGGGAVQVSQDRTSATITLPKPTLGQPTLDLAHSYIYSQQRGAINRLGDAVGNGSTDQQQLYTLASQRLTQAAQQTNDLTTRAQTNTRAMLQGLLRSLGFTDVTVNFAN
jgi:Protein of unknown function (DUF4230)